ncbi:hypothetical protein J1N35_040205 [Gossypium stocksii]|uniref:Uncharacterized protein n=1 Tax=Gossypium stocksii TaxID=47602 RepID=A0A9D3UD75_9ROSI|nr:hypothetical protein J1N35_040205 [Gossypium stocksii]
MVQQARIKIQKEDIESVYSIKDEPSDRTICAIPVYPDEIPYSESDYLDVHMMLVQAQVQKNCDSAIPVPYIPVKIYLDKYSKPITIITFIEIEAAETIMNPDVFPSEWWKTHVRSSLLSGRSCARKYLTRTLEFLYLHKPISSSNAMAKYGGTILPRQMKMSYDVTAP